MCILITNDSRVLLATIRSLAKCPCPRCFVEKDKIPRLGLKVDKRTRERERVDDHPRRKNVELTRTWIFERGYRLNSVYVDRVLGPKSYIPTRVSIPIYSALLSAKFTPE